MIKLQWRRVVGFSLALLASTAVLVVAGLAEDAGAQAQASAAGVSTGR
jgi:hypothetical protein